MVHVARLREGKGLTHEARKPLPEGVDTTLDVASLAFLLADGFVLLFGDHLLVGFPEITVAGCPAPVTADESYYLLASLSTQGQPDPHFIAFTVNEGAQLIQFQYPRCLDLSEEECISQLKPGYFF